MNIKGLAASAAFALLAAPASAATLSAEFSTGNAILYGPNGSGATSALRLEGRNGSGLLSLRLGRFGEESGYVPLDRRWELGRFGNLSARAEWKLEVEAEFAEAHKSFRILNTIDLSYGGYLGRVTGHFSHSANAGLHINPLSVNFPGLSSQGITLPPLSLNIPARDFSLYSEADNRSRSSLYGGLLLASDLPLSIGEHAQLRLLKSAQIGAERIGYGTGAALVYATQPLADDRQLPNGPCSGRPYMPSRGFAYTLGLCADETVKSPLHFAAKKKAAQYAEQLNVHTSRLNDLSSQVQARTGHGYTFPAYTAADVMNMLGLPDPTEKPQVAVTLGAAGNYGNMTFAAHARIPVSGIRNRQFGFSVGYRF